MTTQEQRKAHVPDNVARWNDTRTDYPRDALLSELFADCAERHADAPALVWPDGRWTYRELLERVRRAAARLRARGVHPGDTVGVLLERSPDLVVAALGILEAGAVYLPLDPEHPATRLNGVLDDSHTRCLITTEDTAAPLRTRAEVLSPADMARPAPAGTVTRDTGNREATDAAYLVYTSGSTGAPKGVVCTHRGLVRLVTADNPSIPSAGDRLLATTHPTFDVSCYEIFCTLLNGAALVLPRGDDLLSSEALARLLEERSITTLWLSAGLFHQHAETAPGMFSRLRCLMAGGDALNPSAVRAVLEHGRPRFFLNGYGPSENAVLSTTHRITELAPEAELVPIGRPVDNTTAYVVRSDGHLADTGEQGELWLGGDGVALGYLNDPEKTAQRFLPDRFGTDPDGRLYRTGDVVRQRDDGVLEFLGRRDRQVKVRGFRVELDEAEAVLSAHPEVAEAAVDVVGQGAGERLGAAVVSASDADSEELEHRVLRHARDRLPAYMVPARVVVADELPLRTSGKVDRDRLLSWVGESGPERGTGAAPENDDERTVAGIWGELLGTGAPGRDDDFFALGGTSLLATQAAAAVRRRFRIRPDLSRELVTALLANPTLSAFTARVRNLLDDDGAQHRYDAARPDFAAEAALDEHLRFAAPPAPRRTPPACVLLTGGTGFLGVHLIDQLAKAGVRKLFCLTRAGGEAEARERITARMHRYGVDPSVSASCLAPLPGELSRPRLGLDDSTWDTLAGETEHIVHAGSQVNFAYPYEALRSTNVGGTATVLRLAAEQRLKPVHYVSTIAVIAGFGVAGTRHVREDTPLAHPDRISLGYPESKWVAESMVASAGRRGLPVSIHRPYEVTGTRDRGVWNTDTMMCALFRTIAETGLAPDIPLPLDFVPVDYTAALVTHVVTHNEPDGRVYHLTNPRDARLDLFVDRLRAGGYQVRTVSYEQWVETVARLTAENPEHPMAPYIPMFIEPAHGARMSVKEMYFAGTFPDFDRTNAERAAADSGLVCPPVDARLLDLYLRHFRDVGYLPPPRAGTRAA
ncbi:amino acid adenylation domain-containing protein [Streptomyces albus subsp. chlorinus]|uniref:amino acid adenylation domain-containing protein n=1 Tax=Streptomyces albus TaxID=1888 RepID=UPI00156EF200|nr:amino acid adenylation domain-containing protein [Streptomyces albus]NSC22983.1 amino acid adenylation domain-containing protein [Streptomyces albus subsp. chlorinus]